MGLRVCLLFSFRLVVFLFLERIDKTLFVPLPLKKNVTKKLFPQPLVIISFAAVAGVLRGSARAEAEIENEAVVSELEITSLR